MRRNGRPSRLFYDLVLYNTYCITTAFQSMAWSFSFSISLFIPWGYTRDELVHRWLVRRRADNVSWVWQRRRPLARVFTVSSKQDTALHILYWRFFTFFSHLFCLEDFPSFERHKMADVFRQVEYGWSLQLWLIDCLSPLEWCQVHLCPWLGKTSCYLTGILGLLIHGQFPSLTPLFLTTYFMHIQTISHLTWDSGYKFQQTRAGDNGSFVSLSKTKHMSLMEDDFCALDVFTSYYFATLLHYSNRFLSKTNIWEDKIKHYHIFI